MGYWREAEDGGNRCKYHISEILKFKTEKNGRNLPTILGIFSLYHISFMNIGIKYNVLLYLWFVFYLTPSNQNIDSKDNTADQLRLLFKNKVNSGISDKIFLKPVYLGH